MTNDETWVRVPLSGLKEVSDRLCNIDCIQAKLITGSIKDEVSIAHKALEKALGNHSELIYAKDESEVTHA